MLTDKTVAAPVVTRKSGGKPVFKPKRKNPGKAEKHGKVKVWFMVTCEKHGHKDGKKYGGFAFLKVAQPTPYTKRRRFAAGCPLCRVEAHCAAGV